MKLTSFAIAAAALLTVGCGSGAINPTATNASPAVSPVPTQTETVAQASGKVLKSGTFKSGEHRTEGTAKIVNENGKYYLELADNFVTFDMGPDLQVLLHRSADVIGSTQAPAHALKEDGGYVNLGKLQQFKGKQRYAIPASVNLDDYASAVIWCRKFNATFGAATLGS